MKPSRLGNAALTGAVDTSAITAAHASQREALHRLPVASLSRSPWQPRTTVVQDDEFKALVASIEAHGLLQPIVVREMPDRSYQLLAGERRLTACRTIGHETIPAYVLRGLTDHDARGIALTENAARTDLTALESARALVQLRDAMKAAGLKAGVREIGLVAGMGRNLAAVLQRIGDAITPAVLALVKQAHGADGVAFVTRQSKAQLEDASKGESPEEVARLLGQQITMAAVAVPRAPAVPDGDTETKRPPRAPAFVVRWDEERPLQVRTARPVAELTKRQAADLLDELAPMLKALRARARGN